MKIHTAKFAAVVLCCGVFSPASLARTVTIGRYVSLPLQPSRIQQHVLQQPIQVKFPSNVLNLREAVKFLLQFSGYQLAEHSSMALAAKSLLAQKLPEIMRELGPISLTQGLEVLAGKSYFLLIDPVHRRVAYRLRGNLHTIF